MEDATQDKQLVIYPELSYEIIGCTFDVWNDVGFGHREKFYQDAIAIALKKRGIKFEKEKQSIVRYKGEKVGTYFIDFVVENKIALEVKVRNYFSKQDIEQLYGYLKSTNLQLGLLVHFTKDGIKFKRVLNIR